MAELLSVAEAAHVLKLDPSRVRVLVAGNQLPAVKIGRSWAIDSAAVSDRSMHAPGRGRPLAPVNAWALLFLASSEEADWLNPQGLWRLRRSLRLDGLEGLRGRLKKRARVVDLRAHPGEIPYLLEDSRLVASGVSAAGAFGLDLVSGAEADGYISEEAIDGFVREHALRPAEVGERGNVRPRVVPVGAWRLDGRVAPKAAVALDLLEDPDPRSARAGEMLQQQLATAEAQR